MSRLPKLSLAADAGSHLILAATASTGAGGDQPFSGELLYRAWCRWEGVRRVVADVGFDSEENLRLAELDLNVRATIPPRAGRPTAKPPSTPLRADMARRMAGETTRALYGQRWQIETAISIIKRNLGSALRARTTVRRRRELLLRALTHNVMLLAEG